jgi:hypothetical protein
MTQTVVGVFETSDEARRAQAALLDAQFQPASIRVSAGGTPRGVDDRMAYPSSAGFGGDFLTGPPASPMPGAMPATTAAAAHHASADEGPLERLSEFFRDLFSPEDQHMEMERYEQAVRRGGTLVAVDVQDDLEETLASDILIRAGAYDLEERARSWGRPDYAAEDVPASVAAPSDMSSPVRARPAAMPGNVTSMDPLDPTGYVASRSDTMGSGMPSSGFIPLDEDVDSLPPGSLDTRPFGAGLASPRRSQHDPLDPLGARRSEDWTEADSLDSDRFEVFPAEAGPTEADRLESDLLEARAMGAGREGANAARSIPSQSMDRVSPQAGREAEPTSPYLSEADRMEAEQFEAARFEADRIETDRQEAARLDPARREARSAEAAHRVAQRRQAERLDAERSRMSAGTGGGSNFDAAAASSREADPVPGTGQEMFLDDAGFASDRAEAMSAAAVSPRQARSPISRNVRIYSRRADDPAAIRAAAVEDDRMAPSTARNLPIREAGEATQRMAGFEAPDAPAVRTDSGMPPADPATDMRAELGLRSPLDDQRATGRRVLDDGAPFAPDPYDDDGRRYAGGTDTDSEYGAENGFVDAREPHPLQDADGSEWDHIKRVMRDAWHRMTGHHH